MVTPNGREIPIGKFAALAMILLLSLAVAMRVTSTPPQVAGSSTENLP